MQEAIKILKAAIEASTNLTSFRVSVENGVIIESELLPDTNAERMAELQAAVEVLENAQLIDKEPLNTLLVNALRCNTETQRLLIKNIVERNGELRVKKDPRVDGLPELVRSGFWDKSTRSVEQLVWHKEHGTFLAEYLSLGYWIMIDDFQSRHISTDDILFYCDPDDII